MTRIRCPLIVPLLCCVFAAEGLAATAAATRHVETNRDRGSPSIGGESSCVAVADGRGETVRAQGNETAVAASRAKACPGNRARSDITQERMGSAAELSVGVAQLAADAVDTDPGSTRNPGERTPYVLRITPERLTGTVLTGGTMFLLLQSSFWTYLLVLGLPLWRHVDLLPIVDATADDEGATAPPTDDVEVERAVADVLVTRGGPEKPGGRRT